MTTSDRFSRAAVLGGGASIVAASLMPRCASGADLIPIRVGAAPSEQTAEAAYGVEKGFFKAAGLDVTITPIPTGSASAAALMGGSLDVITTAVLPISEAFTRGLDLRVIAPGALYEAGQSAQLVIAVSLASPLKGAPDLNGKTIAINGLGNLTHLALLSWLGSNGGDVKSVKLIEIPFPQMGIALNEGRVDAVVLIEPFTTALRGKIRVMSDALSGLGSRFVLSVWAGKLSWLTQNREAARRFAATTLKIGSWANANHGESAPIAARFTSMSLATINTMTRAVFATAPVTGTLLQPLLDAQAKYFLTARLIGNDLIWPGKA